jgi:hypothetical protein
MNIDRESRQGALVARMREIEGQYREAVESGDKTLAEALYAQGETLFAGAMKEEQEAIERITSLLQSKAKLFELNLKGSVSRMQRHGQSLEEG